MCLAIAIPSGKDVADDILKRGFEGNSDGAGFGYYKSQNKPVLKKGYLKFDEFLKDYRSHKAEAPGKPFLVHFRIRTHGAQDMENCHPFQLKHGMLIHNGMFNGLGTWDRRGKSDTAELADELHSFKPKHLREIFKHARFNYMVRPSRLAILTREGDLAFAGGEGAWIDGVWFSNRGAHGGSRFTATNYSSTTSSTSSTDVTPVGQRSDEWERAMMEAYGYD